MSSARKKISIAGFALCILAAGLLCLGFFAAAFIDDDYLFNLSDLNIIVNTLGLFVVTVGYALKFFGDREILDLVTAGTAGLAFVITALPMLGIYIFSPAYTHSILMFIVGNVLSHLVLLALGISIMKKGNNFFAMLVMAAFFFLAVGYPFLMFVVSDALGDELYFIILLICYIVEAAAFAVSALHEIQEG